MAPSEARTWSTVSSSMLATQMVSPWSVMPLIDEGGVWSSNGSGAVAVGAALVVVSIGSGLVAAPSLPPSVPASGPPEEQPAPTSNPATMIPMAPARMCLMAAQATASGRAAPATRRRTASP